MLSRPPKLLQTFVQVWINTTANGTRQFPAAGDFFASYPLVQTWATLSAGCQEADSPGISARPSPGPGHRSAAGVSVNVGTNWLTRESQLLSSSTKWNFSEWSADELEAFPRVVLECASPWTMMVNNQAFSRACGTALAIQVIGSKLPAGVASQWDGYVDQLWELFATSKDTTEQGAQAYNGIWLQHALLLAEITRPTHPERLTLLESDPVVDALYRRFLRVVPTSGTLPSVGDDGNPQAPFPVPDAWPAIFERLAALKDDPTYLWAADAIYQIEVQANSLPYPIGSNLGGQTLGQLAIAVD
eukprot:m.472725 g.472725  ORF g.472725 m.472725 type:complete len:302 (+) comp33214_c0_seq1:298-1203(+)